MKQIYDTIKYEWLSKPTGDPFADAGGYALNEYSKLFPNLDILEIIMKATDIYVDRWKAKINPYFLNSKITQPAFDAKQKKEETRKYFFSLITEQVPYKEGFCRISGQKAKLFPACRDNSVLSGSGKFVNFHSSFQNGIMLSKEMIIRLYFLPLASEYLQDKIAVINSNNVQIAEFFSTACCKKNIESVANNSSEGILKSTSHSPGTALFRYIDNLLLDIEKYSDEKNYSITLYHFTNFGASPEVKIYTLPFEAFSFYRITKKAKYKQEWNSFVAAYYIADKDHKKAKYDEYHHTFTCENSKEKTIIQEDDYKYWSNRIYNNLINDFSILPYLLKRSIRYKLNFELIKYYEINIRKMKKETISKIEQMADFILSSNDEQEIKRAIKKLDGVKNSYLLRRFVLKDIVAKYYNEGNKEAIVTIEDYTDYLFPDSDSWKETRDVLLIAIYQKLHEKNLHIEANLPEDENIDDNIEL
jgi:CRISPR-associated protein Cst1